MTPLRFAIIGLLSLLLCGCLEVEQHPGWVHGKYNGKADDLPYHAHFHGDRMLWMAKVSDRNHLQNEYLRANP